MFTFRLIRLLVKAGQGFFADNCWQIAAAISYYALLSLFPLVLASISILSLFMGGEDKAQDMARGIARIFPVSQELIAGAIRGVFNARTFSGVLGVVGLILAGSGVFSAIRKGLNLAWGIKRPRPFFKERLLDLIIMAALALTLFASLTATTAMKMAGEGFTAPALGQYLAVFAPFFLTALTFLFLYRFVPNTRVRFRNIWPGVLFAALAFEIVKDGFFWYLRTLTYQNYIYGTVSTVVAFMTWSYLSAAILLYGAELASHYPLVMSKKQPEKKATPRREAVAAGRGRRR